MAYPVNKLEKIINKIVNVCLVIFRLSIKKVTVLELFLSSAESRKDPDLS